jgi:hypothetical protein
MTTVDYTPKPAFKIYLDRRKKAYYPGETIHGAVRFLGSSKLAGSSVQGEATNSRHFYQRT